MKRFVEVLGFLAGVHAAGLLATALFRLALFVAGYGMMSAEASGGALLPMGAFVRGLWFDNVIGCYILVLPLSVCLAGCLAGYCGRWILRPVLVWMQVLWTVVFLISAANIPYFRYFFRNINSSIWNWTEYGTQTVGLLLGEPSYYPPLMAFAVVAFLFARVTGRWCRRVTDERRQTDRRWLVAVTGLAALGLCIFGMRGRTGYNPIKVSAAYYCEDAFLNQLGVSPTFSLLTSTLDDFRPENRALHLMDADDAMRNVEGYYLTSFGAEEPEAGAARVRDEGGRKNLVVILMESMSARLMGTFGNEDGITPFLDSLASRSLLFRNFYSTGIHTNQGLFATLYSYPAILERNMMKGSDIPRYEGLPTVLKSLGYRTMFFMTHESQYDNMNAFFRTNGYDEIYSQEDYPAEKVVNSFGVQDDFLFDYALGKLDGKRPFLATLLTISNHPPYVIPDYFHPRSRKIEQQIVEYADWSLRRFFDRARKEPWYDNTVFVLLGDHGLMYGDAENELPVSYNHVPLIIFTPGCEPQTSDRWGIQMDVQPTVLDVMGIEDRVRNFGVNLMRNGRPCAFFCADGIMGARSEDRLYIYRPSDDFEARYFEGRRTQTDDSLFASMKEYLFSNLQAAEILTREH